MLMMFHLDWKSCDIDAKITQASRSLRTLITAMGLVENIVPPAKLTEGLTWMITGLGMGVALGAVLGGWVVDAYGAQAGFSVSLAAGGVMLLFAVLGYRLLQDSTLPRAIAT